MIVKVNNFIYRNMTFIIAMPHIRHSRAGGNPLRSTIVQDIAVYKGFPFNGSDSSMHDKSCCMLTEFIKIWPVLKINLDFQYSCSVRMMSQEQLETNRRRVICQNYMLLMSIQIMRNKNDRR